MLEYEDIKPRMNTDDARISQVFAAKELLECSVKEFETALDISEPKIFSAYFRGKGYRPLYYNRKKFL